MSAQNISWIQFTENVVAGGHPTLTDVENRPLRTLLTLCGIDPDAPFHGLVPVHSVKAHGAKGDGATVDNAAILDCVNAAAAAANAARSSRASVHFPSGVYIVDANAVLTPNGFTSLPGITFTGSGWYTSIIRYGAVTSDTWLYDNGASQRDNFSVFRDLGFEGMDPANYNDTYASLNSHAKGWKVTAPVAGWPQGFKFYSCRFSYFDVNFDMEGVQTASEMKFFGCKFNYTRSTVYKLNNAQSFNHEFFGCDVEQIWGDIFDVTLGGAIKIYGGSWIMFDRGDTTNTYFFKTSNGTGFGAEPYIFSGIRFELRGNYTNLVNCSNLHEFQLVFDNCLFHCQNTIDEPSWCLAGSYTTVHFKDCTFYEYGGGLIKFVATAASRSWQNGTITFESCTIPNDWSERCSVTTYYGHIRAISCRGYFNTGAPPVGVTHEHYAHDFDLHWDAATAGQYDVWAGATAGGLKDDGSPTDLSFRLKTAQIKLTAEYWPSVEESTLKLPKNAIIKAIYLRKPANGTSVVNVNFMVGRNDKTGTAHVTTNTDLHKNKHSGEVEKYFYHVGATVNERTLRLYASTPTDQNINGGLAIVEYY